MKYKELLELKKKIPNTYISKAISNFGLWEYNLYLKGREDNVSWANFIYGGTGNKVTPVFESDELSRAELQYWVRRAYKEFYLRPSYLWQRARKITSLGDLGVGFSGFSMLMRSILSR